MPDQADRICQMHLMRNKIFCPGLKAVIERMFHVLYCHVYLRYKYMDFKLCHAAIYLWVQKENKGVSCKVLQT